MTLIPALSSVQHAIHVAEIEDSRFWFQHPPCRLSDADNGDPRRLHHPHAFVWTVIRRTLLVVGSTMENGLLALGRLG